MECVALRLSDEQRLFAFYTSLPERITDVFRPFKSLTIEVIHQHLEETEAGRHISLGLATPSTIAGHGFVMDIGKKHPVFGLGLDESLHGRGLGKLLMRAVMERAEERGVTHMTLTVLKGNSKALGLYKSFGFKIVTDYAFKAEHDSYLMRYDGDG
ncbi:MAG: GNAT family N-acetyltransferase [Spirochaetales bacterium]|nr:GNAT family N-acetyltransferase [Spirochaetales bacterium]